MLTTNTCCCKIKVKPGQKWRIVGAAAADDDDKAKLLFTSRNATFSFSSAAIVASSSRLSAVLSTTDNGVSGTRACHDLKERKE